MMRCSFATRDLMHFRRFGESVILCRADSLIHYIQNCRASALLPTRKMKIIACELCICAMFPVCHDMHTRTLRCPRRATYETQLVGARTTNVRRPYGKMGTLIIERLGSRFVRSSRHTHTCIHISLRVYGDKFLAKDCITFLYAQRLGKRLMRDVGIYSCCGGWKSRVACLVICHIALVRHTTEVFDFGMGSRRFDVSDVGVCMLFECIYVLHGVNSNFDLCELR